VQPTVAQVVERLDALYPPALAADWDAVGVACGDPAAPVRSILLAVDPTPGVADEAIALGADLVIAHHPLLLSAVHSVAATTTQGRVVQRLVSNGVALVAAHTNADNARPGVSDALADLLGVGDTAPLEPIGGAPGCGTGRIGALDEPLALSAFADRVAVRLPWTAHGVRIAGDLDAVVRRVAVCAGSGGSLLPLIGDRADVYVTSDLKHHVALDHMLDGGCALVDAAHWASEWPWLDQCARLLGDALAVAGATVDIHVSTTVTDPWTGHRGSDR
jgi:dinuclear metal center YbgI/SA1388 family protein